MSFCTFFMCLTVSNHGMNSRAFCICNLQVQAKWILCSNHYEGNKKNNGKKIEHFKFSAIKEPLIKLKGVSTKKQAATFLDGLILFGTANGDWTSSKWLNYKQLELTFVNSFKVRIMLLKIRNLFSTIHLCFNKKKTRFQKNQLIFFCKRQFSKHSNSIENDNYIDNVWIIYNFIIDNAEVTNFHLEFLNSATAIWMWW